MDAVPASGVLQRRLPRERVASSPETRGGLGVRIAEGAGVCMEVLDPLGLTGGEFP